MQGREAYGIAYKSEDQSKAKKYMKLVPEDHFKNWYFECLKIKF